MALLHTIERAVGEVLLSEGMRRTLLCTLVRDNLFLQGNWEVKEAFGRSWHLSRLAKQIGL